MVSHELLRPSITVLLWRRTTLIKLPTSGNICRNTCINSSIIELKFLHCCLLSAGFSAQQYILVNYRNYPFFRRGNISGRHSLSENLLHEYYSGTTNIGSLLFGRWLMVVPSIIDHGNSVPDTRVVGSLERVKALQQPLLYLSIFVHMIATHAAKYLFFSSLCDTDPASCSYPVQPFSKPG